jgi:hypothetical protein
MEIVVSRERCGVASACRLIRGRWSREERSQRRRMAQAMQRELWQLLVAASSVPGQEGIGKAVARSHVSIDRFAGATSDVCPIPVAL